MSRVLARLSIFGVLTFAGLSAANAFDPPTAPGTEPTPSTTSPTTTTVSAPSDVPEIDAASAAVGLALLAGIGFVVVDRYLLKSRRHES